MGWGSAPPSQTRRLPTQTTLTILGYGARPYEKTSHSSTPKLQTSDLLENFCGAQDQGEEGPFGVSAPVPDSSRKSPWTSFALVPS